jgi:hypothetical protein
MEAKPRSNGSRSGNHSTNRRLTVITVTHQTALKSLYPSMHIYRSFELRFGDLSGRLVCKTDGSGTSTFALLAGREGAERWMDAANQNSDPSVATNLHCSLESLAGFWGRWIVKGDADSRLYSVNGSFDLVPSRFLFAYC